MAEIAGTLRMIARARERGRPWLLESEGLELAEALDLGTPPRWIVRRAVELDEAAIAGLGSTRAVVKALSSEIAHKTEAGALAVVAARREAIAEAIESIGENLSGRAIEGFLVEAFVEHEAGPAGEILAGYRLTREFGPVVTLAPGGLHGETLARNLGAGRGAAIFEASTAERARIRAAIEAREVLGLAAGLGRGGDASGIEPLVDLVLALAGAAPAWAAAGLVELEMNPVVRTPGGLVALDALGRLGDPPAGAIPPRPLHKLGRMLAPEHVAIAGVSARTLNPGRLILRNLLDAGFSPDRLHVIKEGGGSIDGCRAVESIEALEAPADLLVVAVEAERAAALVELAAASDRAESVILIPGGLGEREGSEAIAGRIEAAIRASRATPGRGPLVNGGNCLGILSRPGRCDTLFIPKTKLPRGLEEPAPLALISQSGAFAIARLSRLVGIEPRHLISVGNQIDLTVGDWLEGLAGDRAVRVFGLYVEGFRPGDAARVASTTHRLAAEGRTIVIYLAGRTAAGARASASHTAAIAGDRVVAETLLEAAGALVAETIDEFEELLELGCRFAARPVETNEVAIVSNAGFECVAAADRLGGLRLAALAGGTISRLEALLGERRLGGVVAVRNPLDVTPICDDAGFAESVAALLEDPGVAAVVAGCVPLTGALDTLDLGPDSIVARLARLGAGSPKPLVAVVDSGPLYDPMARALGAAGLAVFRSIDRALQRLDRYVASRLGGTAGRRS